MCLIKYNNFSFRYKRNETYQLNSINLKIKENKFILLAGATGSGSTLPAYLGVNFIIK